MHGKPAEGVGIRLLTAEGDELASGITNADGRCDGPVLEGEALARGYYRLEFQVGAYFRAQGVDPPTTALLETVLTDFGVEEAGGKFLKPLLVCPFGSSTYR